MNVEPKKFSALDVLRKYQDVGKEKKSAMKFVFETEILNSLKDELGLNNILAAPKLLKVVLNVSFKTDHKKHIDYVMDCLHFISGQSPRINKAKKSISNFKLREGDVVGAMVTLRRYRMYYFLEKLLFLNIVRVQNFTGFSPKGFDRRGNFSFGIAKHTIFSEEIKSLFSDFEFGMDVTIVTSTNKDRDAKLLLSRLGFVFNE